MRHTSAAAKHRPPGVRPRRSTGPRVNGKVAWITDGYGFIEDTNGDQYYFDRNCIDDPRYQQLPLGMRVEFLAECAGGTRQARHVTPTRNFRGS